MSTPTLDHSRLVRYKAPEKKPWPATPTLIIEILSFMLMWATIAIGVIFLAYGVVELLTREVDFWGFVFMIVVYAVASSIAFASWMVTSLAHNEYDDFYRRVPQGLVIDQIIKGNKHYIVIQGNTRLNVLTTYNHRVSAGSWMKDKSIQKGQYVDIRNATELQYSEDSIEDEVSRDAVS